MARLWLICRYPKVRVLLGFLAVYVFWGSTYIGIHFAIQTLPTFLMSSIRFLLAGLILYALAYFKARERPSLKEWGIAAVLGFLLIFAGNAGSTWAVEHIPSGLSALLVATEPIFIVLLAWFLKYEGRPSKRVVAGLLLGLAGIACLFRIDPVGGFSPIQAVAMLAVLGAAFCWALGSVISIKLQSSLSPLMASALMLIMGGLMFGLLGTLMGEASTMRLSQVSLESVAALLYLVVFGSVVALTAYIWLLRKCDPHRVATYAFVNPVVAMFLGWALAGESLTLNSAIASVLIVVSTAMLVLEKKAEPKEDQAPETSNASEPLPVAS